MQKHKLTAVGSVVAAIASSLCCIGPLVAVLLGAGSLAAASGLQKWRPVFLGLTFALLTVAWYLVYRKPKAEGCRDGAACGGKRTGTANRAILWVATAASLAVVALPLYVGALARLLQPERSAPAGSAAANVASLRVKIATMDCTACAVNIQRMVGKEEGVVRAEVVFKTKQGVIEYDPARISPNKILWVINETGFKAEPLTKKEKP